MIGALLVVFLQVGAPSAPLASEPPAAVSEAAEPPARVIPAGTMTCDYDRRTRIRNCINSEGEALRCRRERILGSRFLRWVCFTYREDQQIQEDTYQAINRQQRITTPGGR